MFSPSSFDRHRTNDFLNTLPLRDSNNTIEKTLGNLNNFLPDNEQINEILKEIVHKHLPQNIGLTPWDTFGFHKVHKGNGHKIKSFKICSNIANSFGWLPIIGTIAGLVRIILNSIALYKLNQKLKQDSWTDSEKSIVKQHIKLFKTEIARGAFELTSLGSILFLADIPITIARASRKI